MDPNQNQQDVNAYNVFGIPKAKSPGEAAYHREMERRSFDIIRVKNPDDWDFFIEWDKRYQRVPANDTADVARFWAVKYCRDKAVDMINRINQKMHDEDLAQRRSKGSPDFKDKYEENQETYLKQNYPKTDDRELLAKIYNDLWVGLVYEYGKDIPQNVATNPREGEVDLTPMETKILQNLEGRRVDLNKEIKPEVKIPTFIKESTDKKKVILKEITDDKNP